MKKLTLTIIVVFLIMSLTGCLKDDFEDLQDDIKDINTETDEMKDNIDVIIEKNKKLTSEIELGKSLNEELKDNADSMYLKKEHIQERIEITSPDGLGITKFEFEEAFYSLEEHDDYFKDLSISYLPYQEMSSIGRVMYYYIYADIEDVKEFYIGIILCEDNLHIKEIFHIVNESIVDNYYNVAHSYLYAICLSFVMAKENKYDDYEYVKDKVEILFDEEPIYNDEVQYNMAFDDGYYIVNIVDISE